MKPEPRLLTLLGLCRGLGCGLGLWNGRVGLDVAVGVGVLGIVECGVLETEGRILEAVQGHDSPQFRVSTNMETVISHWRPVGSSDQNAWPPLVPAGRAISTLPPRVGSVLTAVS